MRTTKNQQTLRDRVRRAVLEHAFCRWESAITLSLTTLLVVFSTDWHWILWLLFGLGAEALLVYTSLSDVKVSHRIIERLQLEEFCPNNLHSFALQEKISKAYEYRGRIEAAMRKPCDVVVEKRLTETAYQIDGWVRSVCRLAQRLDDFHQEKEVLDQDRTQVCKRLDQLRRKIEMERDASVKEQILTTIEGMQHQFKTIENLEKTMQRASLQLENSISALGTIYSQTMLMKAKGIESDRAGLLRQEINEEVDQLDSMLLAMDRVYATPSSE